MIFLVRVILLTVVGILTYLGAILFCLFNPRNPKNVARVAHFQGAILTPLCGIKVIIRENPSIKTLGSAVYIANHQSNFDLLTAAKAVQPKTVTIGKKSLIWIPFFGQLYWLAGNILIDRENKSKARNALNVALTQMQKKGISVWMFPEGTRSKGRGLLPFKTGAFRTAIEAGVPIVPICVSSTHTFSLGRWNNGYVIVEILAPIETNDLTKAEAKQLMDHCYHLMKTQIAVLDEEVAQLNNEKEK